MMTRRMTSRDNRGPMIRPLLEESEDAGDEEEEKEAGPVQPLEMIDAPSVQTTDSVTVVVMNPARPRERLVRRSSSAVERVTVPAAQEEKKDGGDKSLRPRFLQERSATIEHITPAVVHPSRVPRSKASAFLVDVLAKSKELSGAESRCGSLEPLHYAPGVTNHLHYVPPPGVQRGVPLRMAGRASVSRHFGRQLSVGPSSDLLGGGTSTEARKRRVSASQEHMAAIVRALQASKQQLHQQFDILDSVLRFINADERDDNGKRPVLKEMVDEGMISELASIMREFRFNTGLQVCIVSILSALAEESPVYAFMMSEFNLEKLIQKTAAIHATEDRLVLLASTLVRAIEDSKRSVNIPAYQAEKAEKSRRQSATYTGAAISTKPKQSPVASPSPSAKSAATRRSCQPGIVATEIARSRSFIKSVSPCGPERDKDNSAGRQRQAFALDAAPPALSASYRLLFSQKLKNPEVQPLQVAEGDSADAVLADNHHEKRDRHASSPSKRSLSLDLTSRSLAAAIYSGGSIFIEPSPLAKRMPFRGSFSAAGVRRKLSVPRRIQRALTERLPPTHLPTSLSPTQRPAMPERSNHCPGETVEPESPVINGTPIALQESSTGEEEAEATAEDDDEESYEDDFDTTGDDTDGDKKMPNRQGSDQIASDGELIDILHEIAVQDLRSTALPTSMSEEINAANTIQRHVRRVLVGREYSRPARTACSKNTVQPREKKTPKGGKSGKSERRGSKGNGTKTKRIPLSARAHRQLQTQGYNTVQSEPTRRGVNRSRPVSLYKKSSNTHAQSAANGGTVFQQRNQAASNRLSNQAMSPLGRKSSPLKQESTTNTSEVGPEYTAEDTQTLKEPLDPEALKQIQTLYAEGLQHHKENHLGLAIECYEKALVVPGGQDFASLHVNLGSALMAQNKFSEALEQFELAKRIQPDNIKAMYNNSLALLHLDRLQEAQRLLRRILELEPSHEKALVAISHLPGSLRSPTPQQMC